MKPFNLEKMLQTIEEQLKKQEEGRKFSENKVAEFIETRVKELNETKQTAVKSSLIPSLKSFQLGFDCVGTKIRTS